MTARSAKMDSVSSRDFHGQLYNSEHTVPRSRIHPDQGKFKPMATAGPRKKKSSGTLPSAPALQQEDYPPPGYECLSPILPKANVVFPGIFSSDDDDATSRNFSSQAQLLSESDDDAPFLTRTYTTKKTTTWSYASLEQARNTPFDRRRTASHAGLDPSFLSPIDTSSSRTLFPPSPLTSRRTATTSAQRFPRESKSSSSLRDDSRRPRLETMFDRTRFDPPTYSYPSDPVDAFFAPTPPTFRPSQPLPSRVRFRSPTPPFLSHGVNACLALFISTLACSAISCVLLGSFALTAIDDAGKRFAYLCDNLGKVQSTIGGVRSGVERVIEGASGALGLVSWAAGSSKGLRRSFDIKGKGVAGAGPDPTRSRWRNFGRSVGSSGSSTPRKRPMSPQASRRSASSTRNAGSRLNPGSSASNAHERRYSSDEEPFVVPHSTPYESRSASAYNSDDDTPSTPRPRSPRDSSSSTSSLPPRPPLALLIPSVFALIFLTFWKLITNYVSLPKTKKS